MPWVRFSESFDWKPPRTWRGRPYARGRLMLSYFAGQRCNVPTACAEEALAKGVAVKVEGPRCKTTR